MWLSTTKHLTSELKYMAHPTRQVGVQKGMTKTSEVNECHSLEMDWRDIQQFFYAHSLQVRFCTLAAPRAVWVVCYLVAAPYATVCLPRNWAVMGSPPMCLAHVVPVMLAPVVASVIANRDLERRERQEFVRTFRALRIRELCAAD
jgi:hypothetical protein